MKIVFRKSFSTSRYVSVEYILSVQKSFTK